MFKESLKNVYDTIAKIRSIGSDAYVGTDGLFDTGTVKAYVEQLKGLSVAEAEVSLSTSGLSNAQRAQVLTALELNTATKALTSGQIENQLIAKVNNAEDAKAITQKLVKAGIISSEVGATNVLTDEILEQAVANGVLSVSEKNAIASALGLTVTNGTLATSFKILTGVIWGNIKAFAKWLLLTPVGQFTAIATAVVGATVAFVAYNKAQEKALKETLENTEESVKECKELDEEIQSLEDSIADLEKQIEERKPLATEQELETLQAETKELQNQVAILKEKKRIESNEGDKSAQKALTTTQNSKYKTESTKHMTMIAGEVVWVDGIKASKATYQEELQYAMDYYDTQIALAEEAKNKLADMSQANIVADARGEEVKYSKKQIEQQEANIKYYETNAENARKHANELADTISIQAEGLNGNTKASRELLDSTEASINGYKAWVESINTSTEALQENAEVQTNNISTKFSISEDQAKALDDYQSKIDSISSSLSDLHNLTASDITSLLTDFSAYADIWEKFGVNEYGEGDIEGALEAIAQKLKTETAKKVPQMRSYIEEMYEAVLNPKGNPVELRKDYDDLRQIYDDVTAGMAMNMDEATKLINKYPELAEAIKIVGDGYSFEEEAIISLVNAKAEELNAASSYEYQHTVNTLKEINARIAAYELEYESIRTLREANTFDRKNLTGKGQQVIFGEEYVDDIGYQKLLKQRSDLEELIASLEQGFIDATEFDAITSGEHVDKLNKEFDIILAGFENRANMIELELARAESQGKLAVQTFYQQLHDVENEKFLYLSGENGKLAQLEAELARVEAKGFKEGSDVWNELHQQIEQTKLDIEESTNAMIEFQNEIRNTNWEIFDFNRDQSQRVMGESDFLLDLLDAKKLVSDIGELTEEGMASIGLHGVNYNGYLEESIRYTKELAKLEEDLRANPDDTNLINRYNEVLEKKQEMIIAAESEKEAIADLVRDAYDAQKEALQELIDNYTEALDAEKNLYDQQKKTAEQTKRIADLRKMIASAAGDSSEETRAQVQKWQLELDEAQGDLESDQYDQYISDQKDILNSIFENYSDVLDEKAEDTEKLFQEAMSQAQANTGAMKNAVEDAASAVGYNVEYGVNSLLSNDSTLNTNLNEVEARLVANGLSITDGVYQIDKTNTGIATGVDGIKEALTGAGGIGEKIDNAANAIVGALSGSGNSGSGTPSTGGGNTGGDKSVNYGVAPAVGDTVHGVTGKWYASSDGDGNSGSVTTNGADTWMISKINLGSKYPYHLIGYKNGKFAGSGWVKSIPEYASGLNRAMKDHLAWTQDGGSEAIIRPSDGAILTPLKVGDSVLTSDATKNLIGMMTNPAGFIAQNMTPDMSAISTTHGGNVENNIAITIPLENVTDVQSFLLEFQRNPKIQAVIKDMIAESTLGTSSLAKYRHKM